ncbi:MAG: hypothetical protein HY923_03750 [Elusimicrobia bacterium]|nr:hypothetical protein [Elusimicrobiota bacterium]
MNALRLALLLTLTAATSARAGSMRGLAKELARQASRSGLSRVAVLPLEPGPGGQKADGWILSERLLTQLVRAGGIQAVERTLLDRVMSEHRLGRTGALDANGMKSLGRLMAVDAIVTGSFTIMDGQAVVTARLIDIQTGLIVAAEEQEIKRDWVPSPEQQPAMSRSEIVVPAPVFEVEPPEIPREDFLEMRDVPNDAPASACTSAQARINSLESSILEIKARYWAGRLITGLDLKTLKANPGSTIPDPALRRRFYARMKEWYDLKRVPALNKAEVKRFVAVDGEAYRLSQECGI